MKKILALMLLSTSVYADRMLLIPAHYWNDGSYHPTYYKVFKDSQYSPYDAHTQCMMEARRVHTRYPSPSYSMCSDPKSTNLHYFR